MQRTFVTPAASKTSELLARVPAPGTPRSYPSGFAIVRLAPGVGQAKASDLRAACKELGLRQVASILDKFDLATTRRVVKSATPEALLRMEKEAARTSFPPLHSLTAYWRIDLREAWENADEVVALLGKAPGIDLAYLEQEATDPVVNAANDPYNATQGYLDAAPAGIDARWLWTQMSGEGAGVGLVDLEQGWIPAHEDLAGRAPTLVAGDNRDGVGGYEGNHGTAVLGQVAAIDNVAGVVGAAPALAYVRMASHYEAATGTALHVANAIVGALPGMGAGDVLLLEVQRAFQPTETDPADFDAIRLAVAHGVVVVEAAGNGGMDLDNLTDGGGNRFLDRTDPAFRDSGAIMVGAARSTVPHDTMGFSNFGNRIDCFAWGENVTTCGYGDLDDGGGNRNRAYTDTFSGTSSASPIVTGAAILLQGLHQATTGTRLSPGQMRTLLANPATGTAQGAGGAIGVMPNLRAIVENTLGLVPDVYVRDHVGDTGAVPSAGAISASPDVIVRPALVADPTALFGEGSGNENSATLGHQVEKGQSNYVYVRMRNRGNSNANGVTARVYWSPASSLVTPSLWTEVGVTAPVNVPAGDTFVVAGPIAWNAADIPATGHYCFVAAIDQAADAAPPLPGTGVPFTWNDFTALIRNHNNVTWRNFNVVDDLPDPTDPTAAPFLIAGADDEARHFDLEVLQRLPRGARVWLEVPLAFGKVLRAGRPWEVEVDRKTRRCRIALPPQARVRFPGVRLPAKARLDARLLVRGTKAMPSSGTSVAVRQLFEGLEVGRVTWTFGRPVESAGAKPVAQMRKRGEAMQEAEAAPRGKKAAN